MRLIDADALIDKYGAWYTEEGTEEGYIGTIKGIVDSMPAIEPRHGLLIPDATLPRKGCYHCMFREGNLCKFLPASVPVVECGKRFERHKECPLVEV